jgi:hypothetical protein
MARAIDPLDLSTFYSSLTVKRLRPLARRRFKTVRPSFVRILSRNPCVAFRLRLCG